MESTPDEVLQDGEHRRMTSSTVGLLEDVIRRRRVTIAHVESLADRGLEPQATWTRDGTLAESRRVATWVEENRHLFT